MHKNYFLPIGKAAPALHVFKGILTVGSWSMFSGSQGCAGLTTSSAWLLGRLLHTGRAPGAGGARHHAASSTVILSPGRVWSEPGDRGMSRAAFPFVLTNPYNNGTHNGLATFLYDDTRVSALRLQMVQETAPWAKYDGWGQAPMTYTPGPIADEEAIRAQFVANCSSRHRSGHGRRCRPPAGSRWLESFDGDAAPEDVSASGFIVDGVIYLRGCETRCWPLPILSAHAPWGVFGDQISGCCGRVVAAGPDLRRAGL